MTAVVALPGDGGIGTHKHKFCKRTKNIASMGKTDLLSLFFFDPLHPSFDDLYFPLKTPTIITELQPEPLATSSNNSLLPSSISDAEEQHTDPTDLSEDSLHDEVDTSSNITDCECGLACAGPCNYDFEMWEEDYICEEYNWWDDECLTKHEVLSFEMEDEWEAKQRTKAQRTGKGLRAKRSDKKDKVCHTRYIRSLCVKKQEANDAALSEHFERQKNNSNTSTTIKSYNNFGSTYTNHRHNHRDESAEVQRAIALSLSTTTTNNNSNLACGLSQRQLNDLMNRELTPEDYELLLRLDETVAKKTVEKSALERFASRAVTAADVEESACTICLSEYVVGETLKILPCGHFFHENCVREWLSKASVNCPIDNLPVNAS